MITETERLILRKFEMNDIDTFLKYRTDPEVSKYQSWNSEFSREKAKKFIAEMQILDPETHNQWIQIAFEEKETSKHIGDCAFKRFDNGRQAEIGITIDREYWEQGYALEGLSALFSYCFESLDLHRIIGLVDAQNERSIRLLTKLGMRKEGHYIENYYDKGIWTDEYTFAILEREWI